MTDIVLGLVKNFSVAHYGDNNDLYRFESCIKTISDTNNLNEVINKLKIGITYLKKRDIYVDNTTVPGYTGIDSSLQLNYYAYFHLLYLVEAHMKKLIDDNVFMSLGIALIDTFINIDMKVSDIFRGYVFDDQGTAYRAFNLTIFMYYILSRKIDYSVLSSEATGQLLRNLRDKVFSLIELHIKILSISGFHATHSNYGVDQAIYGYFGMLFAKVVGIRYTEIDADTIYIKTVLKDCLTYNVNGEYVNKENTPLYHMRHINQLIEIHKLFELLDQDLLNFVESYLEKMFEYAVYSMKPDLKYPLIGDDRNIKYTTIEESFITGPHYENYKKMLKGDPTNGLLEFKVWPLSGYAIYKSSNVYLFIKSSFQSMTHKQFDDNTFVLNGYNEDWLIDSGLYSYVESNPTRIYMRSPMAHNIFMFPNNGYIQGRSTQYKCGIENYSIPNKQVSLYTNAYKGLVYRRKYTINTNGFIIDDSINGIPISYGYSLLHIPSDKTIRKVSETEYEVIGKTKTLSIKISSAINTIISKIVQGNKDVDIKSYVSYDYLKIEDSYCIVYKITRDRNRNIKYTINVQFKT